MRETINLNGDNGTGDRILRGEVMHELDQFPITLHAWLQKFSKTKKEWEQNIPVNEFIRQFEFQQMFKEVHKKT